MKIKSIYTSLIILCALFTSCDHETIRPQGEITDRELNLSGYSGLNISDTFNAFVQFSDTEEKIVIEANENLQGRVVVEKVGNTLHIGLMKNTNIKGSATLNVYINTKNISNFEVSGASKVLMESEIAASEASIKLSGASEFNGVVDLNRVQLNADGASTIDLLGKINHMEADLSGASTLTDYELVTETLDIRLTGASDAYLTVTESIDIEASGASKLNYKGNAIVNKIELSGASEIIQK